MTATPLRIPAIHSRFKVMIVDDSAVVRGMLGRWIEESAEFDLAGVAVNGVQAVKVATQAQPDLVVLDVEMPEMNGLEALPGLLRACPGVQVIMASTLTTEGGHVALQALDLGAADIIAKPSAATRGGADAYRLDLLDKLRRLGEAAVSRRSAQTTAVVPAPILPRPALSIPAEPVGNRPEPALRGSPSQIGILAIAASTGGPPALKAFLKALGPRWPTPILITQHMPANFTGILADQLTKACGMKVREGVSGVPLVPGEAILAPGDFHMTVTTRDGLPVIALDQGPEENFCRPAADPMFRSVARHFGARSLVVVLTGMGKDGQAGAKTISDAGGLVFAQDEASSVVWGMPGAVVTAGIARHVGTVEALANLAVQSTRSKRL